MVIILSLLFGIVSCDLTLLLTIGPTADDRLFVQSSYDTHQQLSATVSIIP